MRKLLLFLLPILMFSCSTDYERISYFFADVNNFSVAVYAVPDDTSIDDIKKHAQKRHHIDGGTTAVYYYTVSSLDSLKYDISTAPDAFTAQDLACTKGCIAGYWKFPTGKENFIENPCKDE